MSENRRAVLRSEVRPLAVHLRWVVRFPEDIEQLFVTHFCRIERHLHYFRVPGFVRAYIFVRRVRRFSTAVPRSRLNHSGHLLERRLDAPEAPRSESRNL